MKKLSLEDKAIHDEFCIYGKNAKEWMNKCVLLLPKIEKNWIWEKKGFSSIYEYAAKIAGMNRNKVNEGLRILKKTENLPEIRKVIEKKGIFAAKPVANIATAETDQFWAKKVLEMKKSTLEIFVRDFRKQEEKSQAIVGEETQEHLDNEWDLGRPRAGSPTNNGLNKPNLFENPGSGWSKKAEEPKIQVSMKLSQGIVDELKKIKGEGDWDQAIKKLLEYGKKEREAEQKTLEAKEKLLQKELKEEKPEIIKTSNHKAPSAISKYIKKRSKGKCEHPNCNKPGRHIHHLEPFAFKKEHNPDKMVYLCAEHHQIIHLGYIDDSGIIAPEQSRTQPTTATWQQIEKLPFYDIKNVINSRIADFAKCCN